MNFIYCRRVFMAYKKEKSKRKVSKLISLGLYFCLYVLSVLADKDSML